MSPETFLQELFWAGVRGSLPASVLPAHLPKDRSGAVVVCGAGKAAAAMARVVEERWTGPVRGLVIVPVGYAVACRHVIVIEASHPVPDRRGIDATGEMMEMLRRVRTSEEVLFLMSGGASALLCCPREGITLEDKQDIVRQLLKAGADIEELNQVRTHLSAVKGGGIARLCPSASLTTYVISDVAGDSPTAIGSAPTVGNTTPASGATAILRRYGIRIREHVLTILLSPQSHTDERSGASRYIIVANGGTALAAAAEFAESRGVKPVLLGDRVIGKSREVAVQHGKMVTDYLGRRDRCTSPAVMLSGGETTVEVKGNGRGGPNGEYVLALMNCLKGNPGVYALAADTDGIDGCAHSAGALFGPGGWRRSGELALNIEDYLEDNDSVGFFSRLGGMLVTGPTLTNVNDFRAIYLE